MGQRKAAEYKRNNQSFTFDWRSTGAEEVIGFDNAAQKLGILVSTLRVYLSSGRGSVTQEATNPVTGAPDILTITRGPTPLTPEQQEKLDRAPKQRGRPRKWITHSEPVDWAAVRDRHRRT